MKRKFEDMVKDAEQAAALVYCKRVLNMQTGQPAVLTQVGRAKINLF